MVARSVIPGVEATLAQDTGGSILISKKGLDGTFWLVDPTKPRVEFEQGHNM